MEIVSRVITAGVSEEEKTSLVRAGEIIGVFSKALTNGEITAVSEETKQLLLAIKKVVDGVVER